MRDAHECAPKVCECGRKLTAPISGRPFDKYGQKVWYIRCECMVTYVWSYHPKSNGCWMIRDSLPLFDRREVVVIA